MHNLVPRPQPFQGTFPRVPFHTQPTTALTLTNTALPPILPHVPVVVAVLPFFSLSLFSR